MIELLGFSLVALLITSSTSPSYTLLLVNAFFCLLITLLLRKKLCLNDTNNLELIPDTTFALSCVATTASKVLEGQMFKMTLSKPKNGNAQHLRVSSVVPLSSCYRPTIETLRRLYGVSTVLLLLFGMLNGSFCSRARYFICLY